jgi:hypothetical protein
MLMNAKFEKINNTFPALMEKLNKSHYITKEDLKKVPDRGIYIFYDGKKPIYVGRSERMRSRLREHSQQSSGHTSATFAFNLAKSRAKKLGIDISGNRKILEQDPHFSPIYKEEKTRVSKMKIKVIRIDNPIKQTLFEVYASMELKTQQDWGTH